MKRQIVTKICAAALSVLMFAGAGSSQAGTFIGTSLPVAASSELKTEGRFQYKENDDGTVTITAYLSSIKTVVIPDKIDGKPVAVIGSTAFRYRTIGDVTLPDSIRCIESGAFEGCTELTSINLPDGLTEIQPEAFMECNSLQNVFIPASVTEIGFAAFSGCKRLLSVSVDKNNHGYYSQNGVLFDKANSRLISFPAGKSGSYTIPDGIKSIGRMAFYKCDSLTAQNIPASVTDTEIEGLFGCAALKSINVDPQNKVFSSKDGVLFNKAKTTLIRYPRGKSGAYIIPDGVTTVRSAAFYQSQELTDVYIPDSVTKIGTDAFRSCTGLTKVTIPHTVSKIEFDTFENCTSLSSVTIPDGLTFISANAFLGCTSLKSLILPVSVNNISDGAFAGCNNLTIKSLTYTYVNFYCGINAIPFQSIDTLPITNKSSISAHAISLGERVTVSAAASEGSESYKYAVFYKSPKDGKWYKAQDYSTNANVSVTPKHTGKYIVRVNIKDSKNQISKKDFYVDVFTALKNTSAVSSENLVLGSTLTVNASSANGLGEKFYAVWYRNPNTGKWYKAQDYSRNTVVPVKPKHLGKYLVRVKVKDEKGTIVNKDFTVNVIRALKNTSTISSNLVTVGQAVKVTAASAGGLGKKQYAVWYKDLSTKKWYMVHDYSGKTTASVVPKQPGAYMFRVKVKDERGKIVNKDFDVIIKKN